MNNFPMIPATILCAHCKDELESLADGYYYGHDGERVTPGEVGYCSSKCEAIDTLDIRPELLSLSLLIGSGVDAKQLRLLIERVQDGIKMVEDL